jgi:hypothetical protein
MKAAMMGRSMRVVSMGCVISFCGECKVGFEEENDGVAVEKMVHWRESRSVSVLLH